MRKNEKAEYNPWYSDEYYYESDERVFQCKKDYMKLTPKEIKKMLEKKIIGQDEACRQIAIMMYQHIHGHKCVNLIAGPTGSGKSLITETLKELFPEIIYLREVSNLTQEGWNGNKKVNTLFDGVHDYVQASGTIAPLIVLDECDKLFNSKTSSAGENTSKFIQSELLSVIHGADVIVKDELSAEKNKKRMVDTRKMSFLFAGAFGDAAEDIAVRESGSSFGFGAVGEVKHEAYFREMTIKDINEAGCISELCGRINKVINLSPMSETAYMKMLNTHKSGPLREFEEEFGITFKLSKKIKDEIVHNAVESGLGVRGIKNQLRAYIDEAIWNDCDVNCIVVS